MDATTWILAGGLAATIARLLWVEVKGSNRADRSQAMVEVEVLNKALNTEIERRELMSKSDLEREKQRCDEELEWQAERFERIIGNLPGGKDAVANGPQRTKPKRGKGKE